MNKKIDGRNILSNAVLAIILILVCFGVVGAHLKIAELKEINAELNDRVAAAEKKNGEMSEAMLQIEVNLNILVKYIDATDKKIKKLETEVAALKKEIKKQNKKRTAEIESVTTAITGVEKDITELRELMKQNAMEMENLYQRDERVFELSVAMFKAAENAINNLTGKIVDMKGDLHKLKDKKTCPLPPWKKHKKE